MSKKAWIGFVVVLVAAVILVVMLKRPSQQRAVITIGATLPLSGDAAVWGKNTQDGIELALEQLNAEGGVLGRRMVVVYEDTKALPREGVSAYRKLTSIHEVEAIVDDSVSSVTLAMAPLAQRDRVVLLATGATAPKISEAGEYIFRIWNSDAYEGEVAAQYAHATLGFQSVAILYINNEYGKGLEQVFKSSFQSLGGRIMASESFEQSSTDMRTQLTKIRAVRPDGLYVVGYPKEIPIALKQAKELALALPLLGTVAMQDPQLVQTAGSAAEGLLFPYPKEPVGANVDEFKEAFRAKHGKEPGITVDVGYDAVMLIAEAIKLSGGVTGEEIRRGLNLLRDYPGVSGTITFDENGDVRKPMGIKAVESGEFVWKD